MNWSEIVYKLFKVKIDEEVLKINEYLQEENKVLRELLDEQGGRLRFNDDQRSRLAAKAIELSKTAREQVVRVVKVDTILRWHRRLIAKLYDSSEQQLTTKTGISQENKQQVLKMARENPSWGYDRIADAMNNLGLEISDTSVGTILKLEGVKPAPDRQGVSWAQFIKSHAHVMWQVDFKTAHIVGLWGVIEVHMLFFIHLSSRKVVLGGMTEHPTREWIQQVARNLTDWEGELVDAKYLIRDNDGKYAQVFDETFENAGIKIKKTSIRAPDMNAFIERWIGSLKRECLNHFAFTGERYLRYVVDEYVKYYNQDRNHQGKEDHITPVKNDKFNNVEGQIVKHSRLGGLLNVYYRQDAA